MREREFIRRVIDRGTRVLGVCLGAQLISTVLGGRVAPNRQKEIGWFPIDFTAEAAGHPVFGRFPRRAPAFHWHGDRFSIPPGGVRLAGSEACDNQAFQHGRRCLALQFHWDYSPQGVQAMIANCGHELIDAPGIQKPEEMFARPERFETIRGMLFKMLDALALSEQSLRTRIFRMGVCRATQLPWLLLFLWTRTSYNGVAAVRAYAGPQLVCTT